MLLLAIFTPPLYFLLAKQTGKFFITAAMLAAAIIFAITVVFIPVSLILWFVASFMAIRHYRTKEMRSAMNENAEILASKMAEKFSKNNNP